jgi:hypothetical protein
MVKGMRSFQKSKIKCKRQESMIEKTKSKTVYEINQDLREKLKVSALKMIRENILFLKRLGFIDYKQAQHLNNEIDKIVYLDGDKK